jgi:hypothetical protein
VAVQGRRVELREDVHLVDPAVYAVAHRHVDQPVRAANRHLKCRITISCLPVSLHPTNLNPHSHNQLAPHFGDFFATGEEQGGREALTAGFALRLVSGKSLVPAPPPRMTATTVLEFLASSSWSSYCVRHTHPRELPVSRGYLERHPRGRTKQGQARRERSTDGAHGGGGLSGRDGHPHGEASPAAERPRPRRHARNAPAEHAHAGRHGGDAQVHHRR